MDIQDRTNITLEEHRHSLKWYQDKINEIYEECIKNCKAKGLITGEDAACQLVPLPVRDSNQFLYDYYINEIDYDFLSVFSEVYCESDRKGEQETEGDKAEQLRRFNLYRVEFLKIVNLLDALTVRICDFNIDSSVFRYGFDTRRAREAFIWLMCTSNSAELLDVQDMNRLKTFYKVQVDRYYRRGGCYYDHENIDNDYNEIFRELEANRQRNSYRKTCIDLLKIFKDKLKILINESFDVYDCLSLYRNYLANSEISEVSKEDINSLRDGIDLATAVRRIYLERFSAYSKMPELQLGHSEFSGVHFSRSNISKSNFINSNFKYAKLDNAVATDSEFSICNFVSCDAKGATLDNCVFNYANMAGMDLTNASLSHSLLNDIVFRDNQLDVSVESVSQLLGHSKNGVDAFEKRKEELRAWTDLQETRAHEAKAQNADSKKERDPGSYDILKEFHYSLTRDSHTDGDPHSLWNLTCAKTDDLSPRLFRVAEDKDATVIKDNHGKPSLVFDEIFAKSEEMERCLITECKGKIIGRDFLAQLRAAEVAESASDRKARFESYGRICFEPTTLCSADIVSSTLPQIDISHVDMRSASFEESNLSNCIGYYVNAETTYFAKANLNGGDFYDSNFDNTNFSEASLIGATFVDCKMHAANMYKALAINVRIVNTEREEPFLKDLLIGIKEDDPDSELDLLSENIRDDEYFNEEQHDLADSNWCEATASRAMLMGLKMDRSRFTAADLSNLLIYNCAVRWSSFDRADISYGLFLGTSFHQSNFRAAILSQAHIFACEFSGCRMKNLTFIGARVDKAIFYDNDFSEANIARGSFNNCVFRRCNLEKLNISNTVFTHCAFYGVNFGKCIGLNSAQFVECFFYEVDSKLIPTTGLDETASPNIDLGNDNSATRLESVKQYVKGISLYSTIKKK